MRLAQRIDGDGGRTSKELWPFYGAMGVALLLVTHIPAISLRLPKVARALPTRRTRPAATAALDGLVR